MQVKIEKTEGVRKSSRVFTCDHVEVTEITQDIHLKGVEGDPDSIIPKGITIELRQASKPPIYLKLPEDGDTVYLMNDLCKTIQIHRWPPKEKEMRTV